MGHGVQWVKFYTLGNKVLIYCINIYMYVVNNLFVTKSSWVQVNVIALQLSTNMVVQISYDKLSMLYLHSIKYQLTHFILTPIPEKMITHNLKHFTSINQSNLVNMENLHNCDIYPFIRVSMPIMLQFLNLTRKWINYF